MYTYRMTYIHTHIRTYLCPSHTYIRTYMHTYIFRNVNLYLLTCILVKADRKCKNKHTVVQTNTLTSMSRSWTHVHTYIQIYTCVRVCVCVCVCINIHTHVHTSLYFKKMHFLTPLLNFLFLRFRGVFQISYQFVVLGYRLFELACYILMYTQK